ncbi:class I SAM-dependent methyltransferase [Mycobacterium decipiens]|uniref:Methyltransferase domain-containing protein n=1 Tax=Mycobacterium decipiens TaxID=1430326 RepID=A0A1X2LQ92_9MYCO|nr:class I SAM-dependent methyltransferase [Mycobacterium decipiens]OSC38459.1 hypothetical protein B8W66_20295 [Mycobacterium decipiens]
MSWRKALFNTMYRVGRPIWDTPVPDEIRALADGPNALPPGKALDVGCGTSGNVAYLARHGWQATGVDFSAAAIKKAEATAAEVSGASFIEGDVTKLTAQGITGPFDLIIDNGCYHTLPDDGKQALARELAAVAKPGALLVMWEGIRMRPNEIAERFSTNFTIEHTASKTFVGKRFGRRFTIDNARWYQLRRKASVDRPN